jgi:hypothetical protein
MLVFLQLVGVLTPQMLLAMALRDRRHLRDRRSHHSQR